MSTPDRTTSRRAAFLEVGASILIFGLFFLYTRLATEPHLIYQHQTPVFLTGMDFLERFLDKPGGLVDYGSLFLAQFFCFSSLGALIITAVAWGVCLLTRAFLRAVAGRDVPPWLSYFPAVLLLMLHSQYDYRLLPSVALLAGLLFAVLYTRIRQGAPGRLAAFAAMSALLYYLAGGISVLFSVLCGIHELGRKRAVVPGVACLVLATALPLGYAMCSYTGSVSDAFINLHEMHAHVHGAVGIRVEVPAIMQKLLSTLSRMHAGLMLFFPLAATGVLLGPTLSRLRARLQRRPVSGEEPAAASRTGWTLLSLTLFLLLGILVTWLSFDGDAKRRIEVSDYAERGDWEQVLRTARGIRGDSYDPYVLHEVNRALYHIGRLPYDMCSYPQSIHPPSIMLSPQEMTNLGYTEFAEWNLELGNVNLAQHWGHLALEVEGFSPRLLRLLAKVHVLQGRPEAAKTILGELGKSLIHRNWALRCRRAIDEDPAMKNDREFEQLRPFLVTVDRGYGGFGAIMYSEMLLLPLQSNSRNKMAFEYLTAFYLLSWQLDKACEGMERLDDFGYPDIPRVYEEALALYAALEPGRRISLHGRTVREETLRRLYQFTTDLGVYERGDDSEKKRTYEKLVRDFGDSYFFFWQFGYTEPQPGWKMKEPPERGAPK